MRAGNDQHRSRTFNHVGVETGGHGPGYDRDDGHDQRSIEQPASRPVGQQLRVGLALLSILHQTHDARQGRVIARGFDPDPQAAVAVDRACDHLVPFGLVSRFGFAGDHGFVDLGVALLDDAVGRNAGAWPHQHQIVFGKLVDLDLLDLAVIIDPLGRVRQQLGQLVERLRGLAHAAHLNPVPQKHDVDQRDQFPKESAGGFHEQGGHAVD